MYGLPHGLSLEFFHGKVLQQICFGGATLILNFDGDLCVNVTSSIGCMNSTGVIQPYAQFCDAAVTLLALLDQAVVSAEGDQAGTLLLRFEAGGILAIYDDSQQFESYFIKNGDVLIVV